MVSMLPAMWVLLGRVPARRYPARAKTAFMPGEAARAMGSTEELSYPKRIKLCQQFLAIVALGVARHGLTPQKILAS